MASNPYYQDYGTKNYGSGYAPAVPQTSYQQYGLPSEYHQQQPYSPNGPPTLHVTVQPRPQLLPQATTTSTFVRESAPRVIIVNSREPGCCNYICSCLSAVCDCICSIIVFVLVVLFIVAAVLAIMKYAEDQR